MSISAVSKSNLRHYKESINQKVGNNIKMNELSRNKIKLEGDHLVQGQGSFVDITLLLFMNFELSMILSFDFKLSKVMFQNIVPLILKLEAISIVPGINGAEIYDLSLNNAEKPFIQLENNIGLLSLVFIKYPSDIGCTSLIIKFETLIGYDEIFLIERSIPNIFPPKLTEQLWISISRYFVDSSVSTSVYNIFSHFLLFFILLLIGYSIQSFRSYNNQLLIKYKKNFYLIQIVDTNNEEALSLVFFVIYEEYEEKQGQGKFVYISTRWLSTNALSVIGPTVLGKFNLLYQNIVPRSDLPDKIFINRGKIGKLSKEFSLNTTTPESNSSEKSAGNSYSVSLYSALLIGVCLFSLKFVKTSGCDVTLVRVISNPNTSLFTQIEHLFMTSSIYSTDCSSSSIEKIASSHFLNIFILPHIGFKHHCFNINNKSLLSKMICSKNYHLQRQGRFVCNDLLPLFSIVLRTFSLGLFKISEAWFQNTAPRIERLEGISIVYGNNGILGNDLLSQRAETQYPIQIVCKRKALHSIKLMKEDSFYIQVQGSRRSLPILYNLQPKKLVIIRRHWCDFEQSKIYHTIMVGVKIFNFKSYNKNISKLVEAV